MRKTVILLAAMLLIGVGQGPAHAEVTGVKGSAFGYFSSVSLFGGPPGIRGPSPTVTLPPGGSNTPITATAPTGSAAYGPAILFSSGPLTVSTQGTPGSTGSVTSTTNIQSVNTSGQEVFTAENVASRCTASEANTGSGSTTITNGTLQTSEGDPNVEGDETVVILPTNPAPNTTYNGVIEGVGDSYRYVFNEQIRNPDGSITVNAAHQYLLGPTAVGELIIGQSVCGVTVPPDTTQPAAPSKPDLTAASDTGASNTDNLTKDTTPTFTGTAEANSTVKLFEGTASRAPAASAPVSASGTWSVTLNGVTAGPHTYTATATDRAGNTSAASAAQTVTVDTIKPAIGGMSPRHTSITRDTTPTIKAVVRDNLTNLKKANIRLYLNGALISPTKYGYSASTDVLVYNSPRLTKGKKTVKIVATDAAGNVGTKSWYFTIK